MKTLQETFVDVINNTADFQIASEAVSSAIDAMIAENEQIDTSYVDRVLYEENKKRGVTSNDGLRMRRSGQVIIDYLKELIIASAKEQIAESGTFRIPGDTDGHYIFNDSIVEKYEIIDDRNLKDEWDRYGTFDIGFVGSLKDMLERHSCSHILLCAYFYGEMGLDIVEIENPEDVEDAFMKIDICSYRGATPDDLEKLAADLLANRNKHLLFHAIKHT